MSLILYKVQTPMSPNGLNIQIKMSKTQIDFVYWKINEMTRQIYLRWRKKKNILKNLSLVTYVSQTPVYLFKFMSENFKPLLFAQLIVSVCQ